MAIQPTQHETNSGGALHKAREAAVVFLARRIKSESEVRRRLGRQYSASIVEQVVQWLKTKGFVDDAILATEWRQQRERRGPRGAAMIRHELLGQGIDRRVVDQALEGFDGPENAYQAARVWWLKHASIKSGANQSGSKNASNEKLDRSKLRRRLWAYLQRRGFEYGLIGDTVRRLRSELSDPLDSGVDTDSDEQ